MTSISAAITAKGLTVTTWITELNTQSSDLVTKNDAQEAAKVLGFRGRRRQREGRPCRAPLFIEGAIPVSLVSPEKIGIRWVNAG